MQVVRKQEEQVVALLMQQAMDQQIRPGINESLQFSSVQFSSVTQSCLTLCDPMDCSMPGFSVDHNSQSLLKLMSIKSVMPSNHLVLCHRLLILPSIFLSIRIFSSELALHIRWPQYWSFSSNIDVSSLRLACSYSLPPFLLDFLSFPCW